MCSSDIFLGFIAILFPPLAVWVKTGLCTADSLINICLCMLGFLPGLLHAWYIIAKYPEPSTHHQYSSIADQESGRATYVVVNGPRGQQQRITKPQTGGAKKGYGTTAPMAPPVHQGTDGTWGNGSGNGEGSGSGGAVVPPSYAEAVQGDHKIQSKN